jgi:hypothetical protein
MDDKRFGNCVYKLTDGEYKPFLYFEPNFEEFDQYGNKKDLFGAYTVATFAIDFAIKQGYEKAVLYGILDGEYMPAGKDHIHYKHFYDDKLHHMHKQVLQAWKKEILSYRNKIDTEIHYQTI